MSKVSARWVPRMLTKDKKKSCLDFSKYLLSVYEDDPEEFMREGFCFEEISKLEQHWRKRIEAKGDYIEK